MFVKKLTLFFIPLALFLLDRLIKFLLPPESGFLIFNRQIGLQPAKNQGLAFSLNFPLAILLPLSLLILAYLIFLFFKHYQKNNFRQVLGLNLIILGALSNLIDRLLAGYVIDYIKIFSWPIFNLGDLMIVIGVLILIGLNFKQKKAIL